MTLPYDSPESREAFEAWAKALQLRVNRDRETGDYLFPDTYMAWRTWCNTLKSVTRHGHNLFAIRAAIDFLILTATRHPT